MFSQKPKRMSVIVRKADELARKGQTDKAIQELNKALTQDPGSAATRLRKAELLARSGERHKACHLFESLSSHYAQRGFYSQAISLCKQALGQCPERYDLMEALADLYLQKGITKEATLQLSAAACACERAGKIDMQMKLLGRLEQMNGASLEEKRKLAEFHASKGDAQSAIQLFEKLSATLGEAGRKEEQEQIEKRMKAIKGIQTIRASQLLRAARQKLHQHPDNPMVLLKKGDSLAVLGQTEASISSYMKAAQGYYNQGSFLQAIAACDKILNLDRYQTEAYLLLVNARDKAGLSGQSTPEDALTDGVEIRVEPAQDDPAETGVPHPSHWETRVSIPFQSDGHTDIWELCAVADS